MPYHESPMPTPTETDDALYVALLHVCERSFFAFVETCDRLQFAVLELVHDPLDGLALRWALPPGHSIGSRWPDSKTAAPARPGGCHGA